MSLDTDLSLARLALARGVVSETALSAALAERLASPDLPLAGILANRNLVSAADLAALQSSLAPAVRETLVRGEPGDASLPVDPATGRYEIRGELGRGGLGTVLDAFDRDLGRDVALKVMHARPDSEAGERFILEARVTGGLEHPNIVPVHEAGTFPADDGARRPYFTMKKIRGRDLGRILRSQAEGDAQARAEFPLRTLVRRFVDICHAMAFAHSRGVLHRDLKPANVMIGDFGETLVVDWGLAGGRVDSPRHPATPGGSPLSPGTARDSGLRVSAPLTLEGDLIGTPAYMSPEQARGNVAALDPRTDIFNLGGILYEILALRPPIGGNSLEEVLRNAQEAAIPRLVDAPADLADICHRCLACDPAARYAGAAELARDVQRWLDGEQERERAGRLANLAATRASEALARLAEAKEAVRGLAAKRILAPEIAEEAKAWETERAWEEARTRAAAAWAEADAALTEALGHDPRHRGAHRLKAEMAWSRFEEAEARDDAEGMLLQRRVVEVHDDGSHAARLRGDGTLRLRPMCYACDCLVSGRDVDPGEFWERGIHVFSGRVRDRGDGWQGEPACEPAGRVRMRVHGDGCARIPVTGARAWIWRFVEDDGRLFATDTGGKAAEGCPGEVLAALWEPGSPYRPRGPGRPMDESFERPVPLAMGSWLAVIAAPGRHPIRLPFQVTRCGQVDLDPSMLSPAEIPAGSVQLPTGSFPCQGDLGAFATDPLRTEFVPDLLVSRHPVTCGEYAEFLEALAATAPAEAVARSPRESMTAGHYWPGPPFVVPAAERLEADGALRAKALRLTRAVRDWRDDWPVVGISWHDALRYAAWRRSRSGFVETLPFEEEWEKGARGADRRVFPWGGRFSYRWLNASRSLESPGPCPVTSFPEDESPWGIRGCGGNVRDFTLSATGGNHLPGRMVRGGTWTDTRQRCRVTMLGFNDARHVYYNLGFRLVRRVRLTSRGQAAQE